MKIKNIFYISAILISINSYAEISDTERFKTMMDQARSDQKAGNHRSAIRSFKKVYSKSSLMKADALEGLTASYIESKKFDLAEEVLKEEIEKNPFVGENRVLLAKVYMAAEKFPAALGEVEAAEKIMGPVKVVIRMKADVQRSMGRLPEAITSLTNYLKLEPKDYVALIDRAECHFALNQYEPAFSDAKSAYDVRPFDERVLSFFTKASYFNNNYAEVKKIGKSCIELFSKNESCYEFLGKASYQLKEYANAIKYFESALEVNGNQPENRLLYAESLAFNGNEQLADVQFAETLKQRPDYEAAMRSWARSLNQRKKVEAMGVALKKFCEQNPSNAWAAIELTKLLFLVGDQETGLDRMDTMTSENKSDAGKYFFAYFLDAAGKHKKARNQLENIKDKSFDVDFHMGIAYVKDKRFRDAIKSWSKIKVESSNYFKSQLNIALAYEQDGQVNKAKEMLTNLSLAVPSEYKTALEQKIASMGTEDRNPAADGQRGLTFFLDWSLPQL